MANPDAKSVRAYHAYTCPATEPIVDDPDQPLVTCGTGEYADVKFLLSPAALEGTDLTDATAGVPQGGVGWQVNLSIGGEGRQVFADLSRQMVGTEQQFAIVLDGNVISFPGFDGVITGGDARSAATSPRRRRRTSPPASSSARCPSRSPTTPPTRTSGRRWPATSSRPA